MISMLLGKHILNQRHSAVAVSGNFETSSCITNAIYGAPQVLGSAPCMMYSFTFGNQ